MPLGRHRVDLSTRCHNSVFQFNEAQQHTPPKPIYTNSTATTTAATAPTTTTTTPVQPKKRVMALRFSTPRNKASSRKRVLHNSSNQQRNSSNPRRPPLSSSSTLNETVKKEGLASIEKLIQFDKDKRLATVATPVGQHQHRPLPTTLTPSGVLFGLGTTASSRKLWRDEDDKNDDANTAKKNNPSEIKWVL